MIGLKIKKMISKNNSYSPIVGLGLQSKWVPGTDKDVISIVIHLSKNTVPLSAKNLLNNMNLKKQNQNID